MVAFNFKKEFAGLVENGLKNCTIRQKARCKVGDKLQLYTGQRTSDCRKLKDVICTGVYKITIKSTRIMHESGFPYLIEDLAKLDGFQNADSFFNFFKEQYGLPFDGYLITWK